MLDCAPCVRSADPDTPVCTGTNRIIGKGEPERPLAVADVNESRQAETRRLDAGEVDGLRRAARFGVMALVVRSMVLQVAGFAGSVALARLLDPGDFGVFAIVQFALSFFTFFGDAGLAGSLIRQKHPPTRRELSSVFFFQIALAIVVMLAVFLAARGVRWAWPNLPEGASWLMRAMAIDVLLVAVRIVPSILLERALAFGKLAGLEVVTQLVFLGTAIAFAALGYRAWSLGIAVLVQGAIGAVGAYVLMPWRPDLVFDGNALKPMLRFGIVYQLKNIVGFINGAITPIFAGIKLGPHALGLVNWARETGWYPLRFVEITSRVTYPIYSRLHEDRRLFVETLERSIGNAALVTFFFVGIFLGMGHQLVHVVYGDKWLPAVPMFYAYAAVISIGFLSPIVGAAFDASGRPGVLARLAIGWTVLNWVVVPIATYRFGMAGFAYGYIVHVVVGNAAVVIMLRKWLPDARIWPRIRGNLLAGVGTAIVSRLWLAPWADRLPWFMVAVAACGLVHVGLLALVDRQAVLSLYGLLRRRGG
jgi:O-antigen/teichoic acid export membrane protein